MALLGIMVFLTSAILLWVLSLRRQVGEQTRRLRERLEREAALEQRYTTKSSRAPTT